MVIKGPIAVQDGLNAYWYMKFSFIWYSRIFWLFYCQFICELFGLLICWSVGVSICRRFWFVDGRLSTFRFLMFYPVTVKKQNKNGEILGLFITPYAILICILHPSHRGPLLSPESSSIPERWNNCNTQTCCFVIPRDLVLRFHLLSE